MKITQIREKDGVEALSVLDFNRSDYVREPNSSHTWTDGTMYVKRFLITTKIH